MCNVKEIFYGYTENILAYYDDIIDYNSLKLILTNYNILIFANYCKSYYMNDANMLMLSLSATCKK